MDTCLVSHHPLSDCSIGVVVEGVHGVVAVEAGLLGVGVPALPDGGGANSYRIEPGSILGGLKHLVSCLVQSISGQSRQQISGRIETGGQGVGHELYAVIVLAGCFCDRCLIVCQHLLQILFADYAEGQSSRIGCLCILHLSCCGSGLSGLRINEDLVPGFPCSYGMGSVYRSLLLVADRLAQNSRVVQALDINSLTQENRVSRDPGQMICQRSGLAGQAGIGLLLAGGILVLERRIDHMINVGDDVVDVCLGDILSACLHVQVVRNRDSQSVPGDAKAHAAVLNALRAKLILGQGRRILGGNAGLLVGVRTYAVHPDIHEVVGIGNIGAGQGKYLSVTGPSQTLVSLRAVCRNGDVVAGGRVCNVAEQLICQLIAGGIGGCRIQRGQNIHLHVLCRKLFAKSGDLDVAVAMEGQIRDEYLLAGLHGVEVGDQCRAVVLYHQRSGDAGLGVLFHLRIKDLGKADGQCLALFCQILRDRDDRNTRDILTHIVDIGIAAFLCGAKRFDYLIGADDMHRLVGTGHECRSCKGCTGLDNGCVSPGGSVKSGLSPALNGSFFGCVIAFALEEGCKPHRAISEVAPGIVCNDVLCRSILIIQSQHSHQGRLLAVIVCVLYIVGHLAAPPALAEDGAHGVVSLFDQLGDVIGVISQICIVGFAARIEPLIRRDLLAIDVVIVDTLGRQIESCGFQLAGRSKLLAEHGRCRIAGIRILDLVCADSDHIAVGLNALHAVKDRIGGAGLSVKEYGLAIEAAVLYAEISEDRIAGKANGAKVRIAVVAAVSAQIIDGDLFLQLQRSAVDDKADITAVYRDLDLMRVMCVGCGDRLQQLLIVCDSDQRCVCGILRRIADTVDVDLCAAAGYIRDIQFDAHIVFLRSNTVNVEAAVLQTEVIGTDDKRCRIAAVRDLHARFDHKARKGGCIYLQFVRADHLCAVPGFYILTHQAGLKAGRL